MTQIDQFESVFRAAFQDSFQYQKIPLNRLTIVSDLPENEGQDYLNVIRSFLGNSHDQHFQLLHFKPDDNLDGLDEKLNELRPDLVISYRNLGASKDNTKLTIGENLDFLLHGTSYPILVMPAPQLGIPLINGRVLTIANDLSKDPLLINYAVAITQPEESNLLLHLEDQGIFDRYMEIISKVPSIDTEDARNKIQRQLMKEPLDYIGSCTQILREANVPIRIVGKTMMGNSLATVRSIITEESIRLLVMRTRHNEQIALHGLAYPILTEIREIPILML